MQSDDTVRIPLRARDGSVRAYALIDAADAELVNQWRWHMNSNGYAARCQSLGGRKQVTILLHRLLLGLSPGDGFEGEHRNRALLDCRRANLLVLPKAGRPNAQNQRSVPGASSRYRGVCWHKRIQKWQAAIKVARQSIHLGYFDSEAAAGNATRMARARLMPYAVD